MKTFSVVHFAFVRILCRKIQDKKPKLLKIFVIEVLKHDNGLFHQSYAMAQEFSCISFAIRSILYGLAVANVKQAFPTGGTDALRGAGLHVKRSEVPFLIYMHY